MSLFEFKNLDQHAVPPSRATKHSVGYDLYIPMNSSGVLESGESRAIPIGIALEMSPKLWAQILSRSSLAKKGIVVHGGVIDSDYKNELHVILFNSSKTCYELQPGHRIAQLIFHPSIIGEPEPEPLPERNGGFGSTGK